MSYPMSAEELKWAAESDARTLAEANVIMSDEQRLAKAKEAAKRLSEEESKTARAMSKVAASPKSQKASYSIPVKTTVNSPPPGNRFNVFTKI